MKLAIVALGPTWLQYIQHVEACGGRKKAYDLVWSVNSGGNVIESDMVWHMDDFRVQEKRAAAGNAKIAAMLEWMRECKIPIMTSTKYMNYPRSIAYPLEHVIQRTGVAYFNSTPAYALAYAIAGEEYKEISLYGMDYTWPNAHEAERGRACMEFWIAIAMSRGIEIKVPRGSTLLDQHLPHSFYGYDGQKVLVQADEQGKIKLEFGELDVSQLPSAAEMEERYNHGVNGHVKGKHV